MKRRIAYKTQIYKAGWRIALILTIALCSSAMSLSQTSDWTVIFWDGMTHSEASWTDCALVSVTSESLLVVTGGEQRAVRLYFVNELSRPNPHHSYLKPALTGAAIGISVGAVAGLFVDDSGTNHVNQSNSKALVAALLGVVGAGLGFGTAIDSEHIRYTFPSATDPEKMAAIQKIIDQEKSLK